jgi:FAD/FMN-containing dehydrogenase
MFQVRWATKNNVPFVAQSGAHAWSDWFRTNDSGIVINMRKLNSAEIDMEKGSAVLGGGITVVEAARAAKLAKAHLSENPCSARHTFVESAMLMMFCAKPLGLATRSG